MNRRHLLHLCALGSVGLAGCLDQGTPAETDTATTTAGDQSPTTTGQPDADGVYIQSFVEGMHMAGMADAGPYKVGLMYTVTHDFWNVNGSQLSKTTIEESDSVHLMTTVWDPETGTVLPETGVSVEVDGQEEVIYPMLSQRMGFHYGDNIPLSGDGTYTATISVGGINIRRTGAFQDKFGDPASADIDFEFNKDTREQISITEIEQAGDPGAVKPMDMMMPLGYAPTREELPGTVLGEGTSDDAVFVVTHLEGDEVPAGIDADHYLAVSARTPYNRFVIPAMALSGTLSRGGEEIYSGTFERTLDPTLNYHYGAGVSGVEPGDTLTVTVDTPPQVARHEGYEKAFLQMREMEISLTGQ
ncbi:MULTISPECIES: fe2+ transport protein [unclassified Haladaptatus]|uniref:DUF7350 domain-containing protein n=1 Tax=unclassified Haladaptatus TaxID=2622732 RepID=UPI0023E79AD1|nr:MULTISPECIES: fe2+ transport protein [unclassified Haladaptatus]